MKSYKAPRLDRPISSNDGPGMGDVNLEGTNQVLYEHAVKSVPVNFQSLDDSCKDWDVGTFLFSLAVLQRQPFIFDIAMGREIFRTSTLDILNRRINARKNPSLEDTMYSSVGKLLDRNEKRKYVNTLDPSTHESIEYDLGDMKHVFKLLRWAGLCGDRVRPYSQTGVDTGSVATQTGYRSKHLTLCYRGPLPTTNIIDQTCDLYAGNYFGFIIKPVSMENIPSKDKETISNLHRTLINNEKNPHKRDINFLTTIDFIPFHSLGNSIPETIGLREMTEGENYLKQPPLQSLSYKEWRKVTAKEAEATKSAGPGNQLYEGDLYINPKDGLPEFVLKTGLYIRCGMIAQYFSKVKEPVDPNKIPIIEHMDLKEMLSTKMMEIMILGRRFVV